MDCLDRYNEWLNSDVIDDDTKEELQNLSKEDIELRFYKDVEFGTAGLRGIMGAGTNYMNKYTVAKITEGLANFVLKKRYESPSAVIAYDSRTNSEFFAKVVALVLNKKNIKTFIFSKLTSTPVLAYASLKLETSIAINITSSHNSKEYNGYKIYNNEGFQVVSPDDTAITNEIKKIKEYQDIDINEISLMEEAGLFNYVDEEVLDDFVLDTINAVKSDSGNKDIEIVYTPLHGTGTKMMTEVLNSAGFINLYNVLEQRYPDESFPTTPYPNPEDISTFDIAVMVAKKKNADIIIASDPDADRMGIMVKNSLGEYEYLSGNQVGVLISSYLLENNPIPDKGVIVKSIVTTRMIDALVKDYNLYVEEVYTGTKYIGEKISEYNKTKEKNFIFGFEESIGYLVGTYMRDKNSFSAALVMCKLCALLKKKSLSILDYLESIYKKYGYYVADTVSNFYEGIDGMDKMVNILNKLRDLDISNISEYKIVKIEDFLQGKIYDKVNNLENEINMEKSNVRRYTLEDGSWFAIRPSGTEPKLKIYFETVGKTLEIANEKLKNIKADVLELTK